MDKEAYVTFRVLHIIYRIIAIVAFVFCIPLLILLYIVMKIVEPGTFLFKQKRLGKNMKEFYIYKIRTMVVNADELKAKYAHLNEYKEPIFKMKNDPRYTKLGRILAIYGIDELPQLINIMKGDMSFVGPRPLPVSEAIEIPSKYSTRFNVLPGMIPPWFASGKVVLSSHKWLELDLQYVKQKSFFTDLMIMGKGILTVIKSIHG